MLLKLTTKYYWNRPLNLLAGSAPGQWCRRRWCRGESAHQKFWFGENPGKILENLGKILWNLGKICENLWNLSKIPENTGKNGPQCALKKWRQTCAESHEDLFWIFIRKYSHKKWPKKGLGMFGEIRAKILPTPKILLAPTPMLWAPMCTPIWIFFFFFSFSCLP